MLRERDDDPQGRLEVVHVDVERGVLSPAVAAAKDELVLAESLLDHGGAVAVGEEDVLLGVLAGGVAVGQVQLKYK